MSQQYLRQLSLKVSSDTQSIEFGQFWCTFNVKRGDIQTPNSLDARIYNVKPETANLIGQKEFTTVTLSAGYPGTIGLLFQGSIIQFRQGRQNQLDSYVDLTAADGDQAYNYATISQSFPGGTQPSAMTQTMVAALQGKSPAQPISAGYQPQFTPTGAVRGSVMYGMCRDEVRQFAAQNNCKWSIQDGQLTFIPWTNYIPGGEVPVISVNTGLIGVPEQTQQGINVRILLNSAIKVGQLIQLDSEINQFRFNLDLPSQKTNPGLALQNQTNPQGLYYVMVANHSGDTRGQNWYTDLVCLSVDATILNKEDLSTLFTTGPVPSSQGVINRYGGT